MTLKPVSDLESLLKYPIDYGGCVMLNNAYHNIIPHLNNQRKTFLNQLKQTH